MVSRPQQVGNTGPTGGRGPSVVRVGGAGLLWPRDHHILPREDTVLLEMKTGQDCRLRASCFGSELLEQWRAQTF